jgi:FkbM family methyltransferase
MPAIKHRPIPSWLRKEVEEYFIDYSFVPKTVLDIGANIGAFAVRANHYWPDAKIICCEPMPFNLVQLRQNVSPDTEVISAAITDFTGIDDIYIGDNFVTGGFVQFGRQLDQTIVVECLHANRLPSCEFVKVDTEGMEVTIIKNLDLTNTKVIAFEFHSLEDKQVLHEFLCVNFELIKTDDDVSIGTSIFQRI